MAPPSKCRLRIPYKYNLTPARIEASFRAIEDWAETALHPDNGCCCDGDTTYDDGCYLHFPYTHQNLNDWMIDQNFKAIERWSTRWARGECCTCVTDSANCVLNLHFHRNFTEGRIRQNFVDIERWSDVFLRDCCGCAVDCCVARTATTVNATQTSACLNASAIFAAYRETSFGTATGDEGVWRFTGTAYASGTKIYAQTGSGFTATNAAAGIATGPGTPALLLITHDWSLLQNNLLSLTTAGSPTTIKNNLGLAGGATANIRAMTYNPADSSLYVCPSGTTTQSLSISTGNIAFSFGGPASGQIVAGDLHAVNEGLICRTSTDYVYLASNTLSAATTWTQVLSPAEWTSSELLYLDTSSATTLIKYGRSGTRYQKPLTSPFTEAADASDAATVALLKCIAGKGLGNQGFGLFYLDDATNVFVGNGWMCEVEYGISI